MTAPDFLVVDEHVARNPVARAIAKRKLHEAVRDFQTRLYMLADGERVPADCQAAAKVLAVAMAVLEIRGATDTTAARIIAGGMGALTDIASTGWLWRHRHAVAVDQALVNARGVYAVATASETQAAHRKVTRIERAAA